MHDQITQHDTTVLVIGGSDRDTAARIAATFKTPFRVLADPERTAYGLYGFSKTALIIQQSGTVLIDMNRRVRYLNRTANPKTSLRRAELTEALQTLT